LRDEFITRLSCARTASLAFSVVQMPVEEKLKELFHVAEELAKWVKRPYGDEGS
jgi:histone H3/H4